MNSSSNISCLVVDDELSSQKVLEHFIGQTEILDLKHVCKNTAEAFRYMQTNSSVDVLFLDINMPKQTGLDFYKSLQNPPTVIFTTAYPQYAVEGFEVNATDYLLKPFSYDRFLTAVNRILNTRKDANTQTTDHIILKENKTLHKVLFKNIDYVEAFGDYVKVHTMNGVITTHSTFSNFISKLPSYFLRVHKSFSINLQKMEQLSGNQIQVGTYKIPIGQTYKSTVLKAIQN